MSKISLVKSIGKLAKEVSLALVLFNIPSCTYTCFTDKENLEDTLLQQLKADFYYINKSGDFGAGAVYIPFVMTGRIEGYIIRSFFDYSRNNDLK